jgi:hypothetical protein
MRLRTVLIIPDVANIWMSVEPLRLVLHTLHCREVVIVATFISIFHHWNIRTLVMLLLL